MKVAPDPIQAKESFPGTWGLRVRKAGLPLADTLREEAGEENPKLSIKESRYFLWLKGLFLKKEESNFLGATTEKSKSVREALHIQCSSSLICSCFLLSPSMFCPLQYPLSTTSPMFQKTVLFPPLLFLLFLFFFFLL